MFKNQFVKLQTLHRPLLESNIGLGGGRGCGPTFYQRTANQSITKTSHQEDFLFPYETRHIKQSW